MKSLEIKIIEDSLSYTKDKMSNQRSSHGWDHVHRVVNLAEKISLTEKDSDPFIVKVAAILHDIAREEQDQSMGKLCHAKLGSEIAYKFLTNSGLDTNQANHISDCIFSHRFRNNHVPSTIEAKILYDADKLDSIGSVGIARAFLFSGEVGAKLHNPNIDIESVKAYTNEDTAYREYIVKLRFIKEKMLTPEGKRIAEDRDKFMELFFKRIDDEVKGIL